MILIGRKDKYRKVNINVKEVTKVKIAEGVTIPVYKRCTTNSEELHNFNGKENLDD